MKGTIDSGAYVGGAGTDLLLLHCLGGTWHMWRPVLSRLEKHHRVIALTLPGHEGGRKLPPGTEPTVATLADNLLLELESRGITTAHVAGNSLGGWLALELARRGFARSVVAFAPAGGWDSPQDFQEVARPMRNFFALAPLVYATTLMFLGKASVRQALARQTMEHGDRIPATDFRELLRAYMRTQILPGLLTSMGRNGPMEPLIENVTPVRLVWSDNDRVIPFERYGRPLLERVPGADLVMLPGVGHMPIYDDPEAVGETILQFIARHDRRGGSFARSGT